MMVHGTSTGAMSHEIRRLGESAARVALVSTPAGEGVSLAREAAIRITSGAAVGANRAVSRAADDALGSLLDLLA